MLCAECPAQLVVLANAPPLLAEKLVSCALAGEGWAFKEIGDRLEGKPMQPIEHSGIDDRTSIEQFTDAELTAIMRSRLKIVPLQRP